MDKDLHDFALKINEVTSVSNVVLDSMKSNMESIETKLGEWKNVPLLTRNNKPMLPKEFEVAQKALIKERYKAIKDGGSEIHNYIKDSLKSLKVSQHSKDWSGYVDFVNNVVVEGLASSVVNSLEFLLSQLDISEEEEGKNEDPWSSMEDTTVAKALPMLQVSLKLDSATGDVVFDPAIDFGSADDVGGDIDVFDMSPEEIEEFGRKNNLRDMTTGWIASMLNTGSQFRRLDTNNGDYRREVINHPDVREKLMDLNVALDVTEDHCRSLRDKFQSYDYLWKPDIQATFQVFCDDATSEQTANSFSMPDLEKFSEKIATYRNLQKEIDSMDEETDTGWLRVNIGPIKKQLASWVGRWVLVYTQHLEKDAKDKLLDLQDFMESKTAQLKEEVQKMILTLCDVPCRPSAMSEWFEASTRACLLPSISKCSFLKAWCGR